MIVSKSFECDFSLNKHMLTDIFSRSLSFFAESRLFFRLFLFTLFIFFALLLTFYQSDAWLSPVVSWNTGHFETKCRLCLSNIGRKKSGFILWALLTSAPLRTILRMKNKIHISQGSMMWSVVIVPLSFDIFFRICLLSSYLAKINLMLQSSIF